MFLILNSKPPERIKKVLDGWMCERARVIFAERVAEWYPRFECYDIVYPQVIVCRMRARWESCAATGKIALNLKLIQIPKQLIDYIIVRELSHLVEHNHALASCRMGKRGKKS